jgi:DNA-binding NarL/FixJ family response regulator
LDQAVSLALGRDADTAPDLSSAAAQQPSVSAPGGLTRREAEIAMLLAEGLSNRQIAERLVISQRTAETHVNNILGKLGLTSRTGVARWVAEHLTPESTGPHGRNHPGTEPRGRPG